MSRSGYSDDGEGQWALIRWRGAVASAIRGKRGQAFLREMLAALDVLPEKELTSHELQDDGQYCALGAVGKARGVDMSSIDPEDRETVAATFGIPHALACEVMYMNDEGYWGGQEPADARFSRMRKWIEGELRELAP